MKKILTLVCLALLFFAISGCKEDEPKAVKIGVSFGVGGADRWFKEERYMRERARELGAELEVRFSTPDKAKSQSEECLEMLADGIDVLIIVPSDVRKSAEILSYARQKSVKVISYARAVMGAPVDLFIGYDCYKIGQSMGQHLTEKVYKGDIILLKGDENDFNTPFLYYGAMKYIRPLVEKGDLKVLLDTFVYKWKPDEAKKLVKAAVEANGNKIDAILAPNDRLAGGALEALQELGVSGKVVITGMDGELSALKRLVQGTQDMTVYLDSKEMAETAVEQACNMVRRKKVNVNSSLDTESSSQVDAYLVNGKVVTRENLNKTMIEPGVYSQEAVYGK